MVWRAAEYLPQELVFNINYLGAEQASFTLNFSKGASQVIGQYYQFIRLGKHGYRAIMSNLTRTADYLSDSLQALGFVIMSKKSGEGLPLVAFRLAPSESREYDEFALAHQLRIRGWVVPAYTMAPNTNGLKMLRVVVREDFTWSRCDSLIADVKLSMMYLDEMDKETIRKIQDFVEKHHTAGSHSVHNHPKFRVGPLPKMPVSFSANNTMLTTVTRSLERKTLAPREDGQNPCYLLDYDNQPVSKRRFRDDWKQSAAAPYDAYVLCCCFWLAQYQSRRDFGCVLWMPLTESFLTCDCLLRVPVSAQSPACLRRRTRRFCNGVFPSTAHKSHIFRTFLNDVSRIEYVFKPGEMRDPWTRTLWIAPA